ncbi:MAG: glycosyltransferase [Allobaculum sp.]|nr:glycosyltransferase [Allobaculum sp.]
MKKIAVLIPCYNESKTIEKVVKDYRATFPHADIYVYDNNSTDNTDEIARQAGAIVRYEPKQGKGNVVRSMFRDIEADCYVMVDGDDTYPASDAKKLADLVLNDGVDMAIGDRLSSTYFTENKRPFHNVGNRLVRFLINTFYDADVTDIMTGLRAFSWDFVKSFPVRSKGFEIETEMTIFSLDNNMNLAEVAIEYRDRPEGSESKLNTVSDGAKVLKTIGTLLRDTKPFAFFSCISLLFAVVTICLFIPIYLDFLRTGKVDRIPTLIMVSLFGICTFLCFFTGVILTSLRKNQKSEFERDLTMLRQQKEIRHLENKIRREEQDMINLLNRKSPYSSQTRDPGFSKKTRNSFKETKETDKASNKTIRNSKSSTRPSTRNPQGSKESTPLPGSGAPKTPSVEKISVKTSEESSKADSSSSEGMA